MPEKPFKPKPLAPPTTFLKPYKADLSNSIFSIGTDSVDEPEPEPLGRTRRESRRVSRRFKRTDHRIWANISRDFLKQGSNERGRQLSEPSKRILTDRMKTSIARPFPLSVSDRNASRSGIPDLIRGRTQAEIELSRFGRKLAEKATKAAKIAKRVARKVP